MSNVITVSGLNEEAKSKTRKHLLASMHTLYKCIATRKKEDVDIAQYRAIYIYYIQKGSTTLIRPGFCNGI